MFDTTRICRVLVTDESYNFPELGLTKPRQVREVILQNLSDSSIIYFGINGASTEDIDEGEIGSGVLLPKGYPIRFHLTPATFDDIYFVCKEGENAEMLVIVIT